MRNERETQSQRTPNARVLIVNEYVEDLLYHSGILQRCGYEVQSCKSYPEGEAWLEREDFDLVIVSQGTPAFEGSRVLLSATARDRYARVLVLTRCADMKCYLEAMQLGAVDYVEAPLAPSEITKLVEWHLRPGHREA
jgi:DNA-binding NtrC family response regulator